jgi:hypothetical protein
MDKKQELAKEAKKNISALADLLDTTSESIAAITPPTPKSQTLANKRWEEKAGVQAKTYKLDAETVRTFAKACEISGKTQSEVLTAFMTAYAFIFCPVTSEPTESTD